LTMVCDERLVERIRVALKGIRGAGERRMFGGVCFTLNGNMICGIVEDELMVRVGPDRYDAALKRRHVRPMDFTGRPMKGYVFVAAPGIKTASGLRAWTRMGVDYVRTLPRKSPKRKRRR
jgi:TfoX/Sxy family transcriptional regulator of competence genes